MSRPFLPAFDIIFAGGGTTACVVAGRLAACDPSLKILILEAGQHTLNKDAHVQPCKFMSHLQPTSTTVTFHVGKSSPHLNGRAPVVPSGRCVGGGSSVNVMAYTRPPASDYDDWGADGWESKILIPLMKKLETYQVHSDRPTHGYNGPIKVSSGGYKLGLSQEFIDVGMAYHKRPYADDTDDLETCNTYSPWEKYIDGNTGRRSDAAHHYVYNQTHNPNLQIWAGKRVKCVIFEDKRAVGVEFTNDPVSYPDGDQSPRIVKASKFVVVSAGAFGSPAILERSGIGAEAVLNRCGIKQLVDLPGVGENYQDHNAAVTLYYVADDVVTLDPIYRGEESFVQESLAQWKSKGKGLTSSNAADAKIKWRPDEDELKAMGPTFQQRWNEFYKDHPEKAVAIWTMFVGSSSHASVRPFRKYMSGTYYTLYPTSVGSVHVDLGDNGKEELDFNSGYLNDPSDIIPLNLAYKKTREIHRRMPSYRGEVATEHPGFPKGSAAVCGEVSGPVDLDAPDITYTPEDNEAIENFNRNHVGTTFHSLGTCAMKPQVDRGVVDARLNVYGVTNLKVADMSIAPKNVGTNTYSTALLIGEKAAIIIAEDLGIDWTARRREMPFKIRGKL